MLKTAFADLMNTFMKSNTKQSIAKFLVTLKPDEISELKVCLIFLNIVSKIFGSCKYSLKFSRTNQSIHEINYFLYRIYT